jgi:hypothetical protein
LFSPYLTQFVFLSLRSPIAHRIALFPGAAFFNDERLAPDEADSASLARKRAGETLLQRREVRRENLPR